MTLSRSGAAADASLTSRAEEICHLFIAEPGGYDQIFDPSFRSAVPDQELTKILKDYFSQGGAAKSVAPLAGEPGAFVFSFEKGMTATVHLTIDPQPPHRVMTFNIGLLQGQAKSFDDVVSQLKKLPGTASLLVVKIEGSELKPLAELNGDQPLAIGSAFKLYVLAALVNEVEAGRRHFEEVTTLTDAARSLPSGFLQNWPVGSPITLHTLASLMISQSDNTAADGLIALLGRENVETMLAATGHAHPALNVPFLQSLELFKLKSDPSGKLGREYLADSVEDRRKMLAGPIAGIHRDAVIPWDAPRQIDKLEWFASTRDLARAMIWLKLHTEKPAGGPARDILSISHPLQLSPQQWDFVGYKGGSEPGVLNLTYLLHATGPGDRWFVVCATWNDPAKSLDEASFLELVRQSIELTR